KVVKSIAGNILDNTTYDFFKPGSEEVIDKVTQNNYSADLRIKSPYNTWHYWNGVLNIAMLDLAEYFNDSVYRDYSFKNYEFAFNNAPVFVEKHTEEDVKGKGKWHYPFGQFIVTEELDDCGAMGGGLIEVYQTEKREDYLDYITDAAEHILEKQDRLADGTLVRSFPHEMTLWGDDLYMSIVFLARMGDLTGEQKYFDDAVKQVINFTNYLFDPHTQLYYHCWYSDIEKNGVAHWGRCNGWVMLAQADLLEFLPEDHPQRDTLISIFSQQVLGISRYQSQSGLWHQVLNKTDSYLETSSTAMFTYSIAKAVNNGWIPKRYRTIAYQGWNGVKSKVRVDGNVEDICVGTGIRDDLVFYYNRPTQLNDIHGLGAVLMAGVEVIKLKKSE
ncbi:MAG: glycoside hydrolase family 88/105 protein, partial [Bacteroidota bacterium]